MNDVLTEKKQEEVVEVKDNAAPGSGGNAGSQKGGAGAGNAGRPPANVVPAIGLGPLPSGMPPIGETRFATNEIVVQLGLVLTPKRLADLDEHHDHAILRFSSGLPGTPQGDMHFGIIARSGWHSVGQRVGIEARDAAGQKTVQHVTLARGNATGQGNLQHVAIARFTGSCRPTC